MARIWFRRRDRQAETPEQEQARLQRERLALAVAYRRTFSTPHGQEVLADLLRRGRIMQRLSTTDPLQTYYDEGRRQFALEIVELLNADPGQVNAMILSGDTQSLFPSPTEPSP